jgi:M6 family metalloprotease-like protein
MGAFTFIVGVGACTDGNAPIPDVDPPPTPYLRSSAGVRVNGATRVVVIPTQFADGPAPSPTWTPTEIQRRYFGGNGVLGPAAAPYGVASEGKFRLRGDVTPWVKTTKNGLAITADNVIEAVTLSDASVDFSKYDNDGPDGLPNSGDDDSIVDGGVVLLHSSVDLTCNPPTGTAAGPHPHARLNWRTSPAPGAPSVPAVTTQDASAEGGMIGIQGYTIMAVTNCGGVTTNSSVLAHELGHLLFAIPDLYHAAVPAPSTAAWTGRRWVLGCWELMSAGSGWGCGSGAPVMTGEVASTFGAWARTTIGWTTPEVVPTNETTTHTLNAVGRGGTTLKLMIADGEYLLVEYREQGAGDMKIPGHGVLISHITESLPFRPQNANDPRKYRVALVEADDDSALVRIDSEGGNRGVLGDAFGRTVTSFASATHSAAKANSGAPLPFKLDEISFNGMTGRARVRVVPIP